jgi:hypothetical protein
MAVFTCQRDKALLQIKSFCPLVKGINKYSVYAHSL